MPSSKRRSSRRGPSPSESPFLCDSPTPSSSSSPAPAPAPAPVPAHGLRTPDGDLKENARAGGRDGRAEDRFDDVLFTATVIAIDDREAAHGRAFLWMSEGAMVSIPISIGSLVSISALAADRGHGSLQSLHELCISRECVEVPCVNSSGTHVAIATAWPSRKLEKSEVRLSRVLASTLGSLPIGSPVSLKPLKILSSKANFMQQPLSEREDLRSGGPGTPAILRDCVHVFLRLCAPSDILPEARARVTSLSLPAIRNDVVHSRTVQREVERHGSPNSAIELSLGRGLSSPLVSRSPGSKETPPRGGRNGNGGNVPKQVNEIEKHSWASIQASFEEGKEKVKTLLETFAARWIAGRCLLPGNVVQIPLSGCDCVFLVTDTEMLTQATEENISDTPGKILTCSESDLDNTAKEEKRSLISSSLPLEIYVMGQNTRATLLRPITREEQGEDFRYEDASRSDAGPVHEGEGLAADIDRIEYSALGGLTVQIDKLKQLVELSVLHPETLARYGLRPVRGVLLHGPPGTGKSSLARAAACEAGVKLFTINGPELVSEFYGQSEASIQEVFVSAAKAAPSVVFIDELDAIAPARQDGSEELGQRMVAALLTLMDGGGKDAYKGVLVIGASNRTDAIDPALRRPGRFDVEIEIGVPSPSDREDILHVVLRDMQHTLKAPDVAALASTTHGFVGADLFALCNEAAMFALRRSVDFQDAKAPVARLSQNLANLQISPNSKSLRNSSPGVPLEGQFSLLAITFEDFQKAMTKVRPSAMREVALEVPNVRWTDIGGQDDVKQKLKEIVEWPQKQSDAIARIGVEPPHGVLLHGPPGCSKTMMARAVASETGLNFIAVKGPELFSKWVGESEKAVRALFARARAATPSVVFFDEIDGLAVKREGGDHGGVSVGDRVISQLLAEMDGLVPMKGVSVIAATNRLDIIDDALLRPGRFDRILYVGPPDEKSREQIFRIHLRQMPCGPDVCPSNLASRTINYTGADISAVCQEAAMAALMDDINAQVVQISHFDIALNRVQSSCPGIQ